jgi:hypothetical protein
MFSLVLLSPGQRQVDDGIGTFILNVLGRAWLGICLSGGPSAAGQEYQQSEKSEAEGFHRPEL